MEQYERTYRKRFYLIVGCGSCGLLAFTWLFVEGGVSQRGFAALVLFFWAAMFAAIALLIRSTRRAARNFREQQIATGVPAEKIDMERARKNIRSCKILIGLFAFLLVYGLFTTQGDSIAPRMAGAGFDLLIIAACSHSLLRSRKKLKAISAGGPGASSEEI